MGVQIPGHSQACLSTPHTHTKPGQGEHSKQRDGSVPIVIAQTPGPYQNKGEQIAPLYPTQAVCQIELLVRAMHPHLVCLLSWTGILPHHFSSHIERGERKRITPIPTPVVPRAVNTSHRLHPCLAASIQGSDCRLLYDCLVLFSVLGFFSALAALIRPPLPGQQSHCLFKWKRQWISESLSIFLLY